jgi:hypothetical protein
MGLHGTAEVIVFAIPLPGKNYPVQLSPARTVSFASVQSPSPVLNSTFQEECVPGSLKQVAEHGNSVPK